MARVMYTTQAHIRLCRINGNLRLCLLLIQDTSSDVILVGGKLCTAAELVQSDKLGIVQVRVKSRGRAVYWSKVMWADLSSKEAIHETLTKTDVSMARRSMMSKHLSALSTAKHQLLF